jgi:colicin import membrane protein
MGELRESSMLISLQALMETEQARVIEEQERRLRAETEAERRRLEGLLEKQRAEERRKLAEQLRVEAEERRRREEEARLVAIRHAELERIRLETDHRAALDLLARKEQHEREIAALRAEESRGSSRYLLWSALALALCVAVPSAVYFFAIAPANDGLRASYQVQIAAERKRAEEASRLARDAELKRLDAERALDESKRRSRDAVQPAPTNKPPLPKGTGRPPPAPAPSRKTGCKSPDDPMDFCL